ncbi:MAG: hypothetical protein J0L51_00415 [Rhizobiales bacterium]|nr:hypothetical protein [Hyphomicrobiales bacterium]
MLVSKQPDLILGLLPVEDINRTLNLELDAGLVVFSRAAQRHAAARHPSEYPVLQPHVAAILAAPLYLGDDFRNLGKIELIGTAHGLTGFVLVAITVERDEQGHYHVASLYPVSRGKIESRKAKGFLRLVQKK